jgi:NADPH:quinone reductase-like Zn-dependent oxidoreductase
MSWAASTPVGVDVGEANVQFRNTDRLCPGPISRRSFLQLGAAGALGLSAIEQARAVGTPAGNAVADSQAAFWNAW